MADLTPMPSERDGWRFVDMRSIHSVALTLFCVGIGLMALCMFGYSAFLALR